MTSHLLCDKTVAAISICHGKCSARGELPVRAQVCQRRGSRGTNASKAASSRVMLPTPFFSGTGADAGLVEFEQPTVRVAAANTISAVFIMAEQPGIIATSKDHQASGIPARTAGR